MGELQVSVSYLLNCMPSSQLDFLASELNVDWNVKKLGGKELFQLCLFGLLSENESSSRTFSSFYSNRFFRQYADIPSDKRVSHSSIAERIGKIKVDYFEGLYRDCVATYSAQLTEKERHDICIYDSTITSISSRLIDFGMNNGQKNKTGKQGKKSFKFSVGFDGFIPTQVAFYQTQEMVSEDKALGEVLTQHLTDKEDVVVFDRGMKDRRRMARLHHREQYFVTRIQVHSRYEQVIGNQVIKIPDTDKLRAITEKEVYLFSGTGKVYVPFRLVEAQLKTTGEPIWFLSNLPDEVSTLEITQIYQRRWEIEGFFRFIKQNLRFKHFFSRTWNGIQVMTYMVLIASILLLVYMKLNRLKGYKLAKINFCNQLQDEILKDIVRHCGGDPEKLRTI